MTALITLNKRLSPLQIDADTGHDVTLRDVLTAALLSNLTIKISHAGHGIYKMEITTGR